MAVTKEKSAEVFLDVFTDHYATLIETLPVKSLIAKFVSAKIINFSDQNEILKGDTDEEKARRFLRHIVSPLETGNPETFRKMLSVVEEHGGAYAYLAKNIKVDLSKRGVIMSDSEDVPDAAVTENKSVGSATVPLSSKQLAELIVPNMATKWFEMGLQLGVNPKDLKTIQHDAKNSKEACIKMFNEWLANAKSAEKSWKKVLDALCSRSVGENTLAMGLRYLQ